MSTLFILAIVFPGLLQAQLDPTKEYIRAGGKLVAIELRGTAAPVITVTVSPSNPPPLQQGQTQQFTAVVAGTTNQGVAWEVIPTVGAIATNGIYTAPATISSQQTVTIKATSVVDTSKSHSVNVTLMPPAPVITVAVTPSTHTMGSSQQQTFSANVTGTLNQAVTWSLNPAVGSINSGGVYTAPASVTVQQSVVVRATSVADTTKWNTATVTLLPVSIGINPTTASLSAGEQRQFTATVSYAAKATVNWTRSPAVGTLGSSGIYTAPTPITTQQTVTVTATSAADPSKSVSATVTLNPPAGGNIAPTVGSASPTNSSGWANVFTYVVNDANGFNNLAAIDISYSTGTGPPFAGACWFTFNRSLNQLRLWNDAGSGYVTGTITPSSSSNNLSNQRCTLIGGSLVVTGSGNSYTIRVGIGFTPGTYQNFTTRIRATDTPGATSGWVSSGSWVIPTVNAAPHSPAATGWGSQTVTMGVSLVDPNNVSLSSLDIDDIQTLISTNETIVTNTCHFFYFAPADSVVLMASDGVRWAGVTKAGSGGTTIQNGHCSINGGSITKSYDSATKKLTVSVPLTAQPFFTGFKYVYVGGSDRPGSTVSRQFVHYWDIY
jgi:hypothetical protein